MCKLIGIGEALIDMIPTETDKPIRNVAAFMPIVGGAPANVCGAFSKLSGQSQMITQLGNDPFGEKIIETFLSFNIGCEYIQRTDEANTALAFVALKSDGNREFSFYRKPSADMLLSAEQIQENWFEGAFALHMCSVSLGNFPMKEAHKKAISFAKSKGALVSFDPNLRFNLWPTKEALKEAVVEFLPYADVLKVSDEELEFITGIKDEEEAIKSLFKGDVKLVVYTKGADGACAYTKSETAKSNGVKVDALDTTGAGDAFIGSFLYSLSEKLGDDKRIEDLTDADLKEMLDFSNLYCAKSVMKNGAIESYPSLNDMSEE